MTSTHISPLFIHFENYLPLNEEEKVELGKRVTERNIKRRQFILQKDDVCKHYTFVVQGLCKMYASDAQGVEHIIQFASEGEWITDIGSFHSGKESRLYIEAIDPSLILQIKKEDLLFLYTSYPKFDRNFRVIIENKYILLEERVLQNISYSAEERYQNFVQQYPKLANRIPNTLIASYLGITAEFLSKVRHKLAAKPA